MLTLPRVVKTEEDVDRVALHIKEQLRKAHEDGHEGIALVTAPEIPVFRLTLEDAARRAERFLEDSAAVHFHRLQNMKEEGDIWRVQFDIGVIGKKSVEVAVNNQTGSIEGYGPLPGSAR
jgi:hypothetical protein